MAEPQQKESFAQISGSGSRRLMGIGKHLRLKRVDGSIGVVPCRRRQSRFPARLFEKFVPIPSVLSAHLGKQQPSEPPLDYIKPVPPHFDFLDASDAMEGCEHGNFYSHVREFVATYRQESDIFQSCAQCTMLHDFGEFLAGIELSNAASKFLTVV